jgi:hypothetical protein
LCDSEALLLSADRLTFLIKDNQPNNSVKGLQSLIRTLELINELKEAVAISQTSWIGKADNGIGTKVQQLSPNKKLQLFVEV